MFEKLLPYEIAHAIMGAYIHYLHQFKRITKRGQIRFENRDWQGIQADTNERQRLYRNSVGDAVQRIQKTLGDEVRSDAFWLATKEYYAEDVANFNTKNIAETFYNSVFRHAHKGLSADANLMFVHATSTYREFRSTRPIFYHFFLEQPLHAAFNYIFSHYKFDAAFEDLNRDINYIIQTLEHFLEKHQKLGNALQLEMLKSVFFRNKTAYIVGRLIIGRVYHPFVLPLWHKKDGIVVDALLLTTNQMSSIFSYHRAYFLVDVDIASETVDFLQSILPTKGLGELYSSIGFEKHGKTVFYRDFLRHLNRSNDKFILAPGIRGMVMRVFTLPSYDVVFKLIKDKFEPPKKMTEAMVKEKYRLVHDHDRVGRMTDFHTFENLVFERNRFDKTLLDELLRVAPSKIVLTEDTVEILHLYVEKKMTPLNIYLNNATLEEAEDAIIEYGKAIKQLAAANIFPGDMLLKNFGVTRLRRVVFYDYDEIGFLTDYNFRVIPEARTEEEEMSATPWYSVGENDIFPEEFRRF
ncbi:MAG: bifunctional isocitrate dehydrogenase kinase/phosphatase, partial [Bacteroidota bacterium]